MARSPRSPWPEPGDDEQPAVCVEMTVPRWVRWALTTLGVLAVISLAINVLTVIYATDVNRQLDETADYIAGKGDQRDAENDRLNQRIDEAVCSVLDRLPAGELFDPAREEYGCGPGIPLDQLDPAAAQNLADILGTVEAAQPAQSTPEPTAAPEPTSAPDEMPPGAPAGAQPSPMGQPPTAAPTTTPAATSPAPTTAAPTTATPPLVDLSPVTDPVCDLLRICL